MGRPKSELTKRVEILADFFGCSPETIRGWHTHGCDLFEPDGPDGFIEFWRAAQQRRRNRNPYKRTRYGQAGRA